MVWVLLSLTFTGYRGLAANTAKSFCMNIYVENHTAAPQRQGHTFSSQSLEPDAQGSVGWEAVYQRALSHRLPILILDPWGKWPDGGDLATLVDQYSRLCEWYPPAAWFPNDGDPRLWTDLSSLNLLTRLTQPIIFKLGWIPTHYTPVDLWSALYPITSVWARSTVARRPRLCFDALSANQDFASWVIPTCAAWGYQVISEGWLWGSLPCHRTLLSWHEFQSCGGFSAQLRSSQDQLILLYDSRMTQDDCALAQARGWDVAYTPDTLPNGGVS